MPDLSFEFDWVDAEGINGRELSATWASFRIRAGDSHRYPRLGRSGEDRS